MKPEDLKAGDQIIATEDAYYKHAPHIRSQRKGDLLMVNNPRIGDSVGGTGLNGYVADNGRPRIGLGCSFRYGTFRRATPRDPGYMATREVWEKQINRELRDKNTMLAYLLVWLVFLLLVSWFR